MKLNKPLTTTQKSYLFPSKSKRIPIPAHRSILIITKLLFIPTDYPKYHPLETQPNKQIPIRIDLRPLPRRILGKLNAPRLKLIDNIRGKGCRKASMLKS